MISFIESLRPPGVSMVSKTSEACRRVGESLVDVGRQDRLDLTVEFQFHNERIAAVHLGTGQRRQQRGGKGTHRGKNHKTGSGGSPPEATGSSLGWPWSAHGAPPPGFLAVALEFCKCSSNCFAPA